MSGSQLFAIEKPDKSMWDRFIDLLDSIPGFIIYGLFVIPVLLLFFLPFAIALAAVIGVLTITTLPLLLRSRIRDRKLVRSLQTSGRTLAGADCVARLLRGEGTLILEGSPFGRKRRWWWTADLLDAKEQVDLERWAELDFEIAEEVYAQYQRDYFGPDGNALLARMTREDRAALIDKEEHRFKKEVRWIEVLIPPKGRLRHAKRPSQSELL